MPLPLKNVCGASLCQLIHSWAPSLCHTQGHLPRCWTSLWLGVGKGFWESWEGCGLSHLSDTPTHQIHSTRSPRYCPSSGAYFKSRKASLACSDWLLCGLIGAPTSLSPALCNENEQPCLAQQRNLKVACASQSLTKKALFCCQAHGLLQLGAFVGSCRGGEGCE